MNVAAIGIGGAGCRIVDLLAGELGTGSNSRLAAVHAVDTDTEELARLDHVPENARHVIGQFETGGEGTDGDRELAAEIIDAERTELRRAIEDGIASTVDAIVPVAGLAGGTGSAVMPALTGALARVYEQPVYTVSVLPATDGTGVENTAAALRELSERATAQILFDNDAWLRGEGIETRSSKLNATLVARLARLLEVGHASDGGNVGQRVVDSRDVLETLDGGGFVSLGYASRDIVEWRDAEFAFADRLKRRLLGDDTADVQRSEAIRRTLDWATRGTLTVECPRGEATHGLLVFRGPPQWLRGDAITRGREWFTDRTGVVELRTGDAPVAGANSLDVFVVFAGIDATPRTERIREPGA